MRAPLWSVKFLAVVTIAGLLLSSAPPLATPRALAMAGPARPAAAEPAAPVAAPAPRVLSSVPVDSPAVPHPTPPPPSPPARAPIAQPHSPDFGKLPLFFVPNTGQSDSAVRFQAYGLGGQLAFTPAEVVLSLPSAAAATDAPPADAARVRREAARKAPPRRGPPIVVRIRFEGAAPTATIAGATRLPGIVNYFLDNDPAKWRRGLPTYAGIVYRGLYDGIDLQYDGSGGRVKSTYRLAVGAAPDHIRWRYNGATGVRVDDAGNLLITLPPPTGTVARAGSTGVTTPTTLIEQAPLVWQTIAGRRVQVRARYRIGADGSIGFALGAYDTTRPLTIDPVLSYSTFLGGAGNDAAYAIGVDGSGYIYAAGYVAVTNSSFVTKLSPDGQTRLYWTIIGNTDGIEGLAVDAAGNASVVGLTTSGSMTPILPLPNGGNSLSGDEDAFVARLDSSGVIVYNTYLGGSDFDIGLDIAIDTNNNAYVTGYTSSPDFLTTVGAFQTSYHNTICADFAPPQVPCTDAFVSRIGWNTSTHTVTLSYSSYFGGDYDERGNGIAVDSAGVIYLTGQTTSPSSSFPLQNATQSAVNGTNQPCTIACSGLVPTYQFDAFVAKLNPSTSTLGYSTYIGGELSDFGEQIAVDAQGNAYVVGDTYSDTFPTVNALQPACVPEAGLSTCDVEGFVTKVTASGATVYRTYLSGSKLDEANDVAVTSAGEAIVVGATRSPDFPVVGSIHGVRQQLDAYVAGLSTDGSSLFYGAYLGGNLEDYGFAVTLDSQENVYIAGQTQSSSTFPLVNPYDNSFGGGFTDAFVAVLGPPSALRDDQNRKPEKCPCANSQRSTVHPVNTRTGNFWTDVTDLAVQSPGPALAWTRTYNSQATKDVTSSLGFGWQHPFNARLITPSMAEGEPGRVIVLSPKGNRLRFTINGAQYQTFPGVYDTLVHANGVYTQTLREQNKYVFSDTTGRLVRMVDPQGRRIDLTYIGNHLTKIADATNLARTLTLTYTGDLITRVGDGQREIAYTYAGGTNDLVQVQDVRGQFTSYTYQNHLITRITDPLNQVERIGYNHYSATGRVITQTLPLQQDIQFTYLNATSIITTTGADGSAEVQRIVYDDRNMMTGMLINNQSLLGASFDGGFNPGSSSDGRGNTTQFVYASNGVPLTVTNALNQRSRMFYDGNSNLIKSIDTQGVTSLFRYDASNNLISTTVGITSTSPLRATTLYQYQYLHGGTWNTTEAGATDSRSFTQTGPDGTVTRTEYGAPLAPHQVTRTIAGYENGVFDNHAPDRDVITAYRYDQFGRVISTTVGLNTPVARTDLTGYNLDNTIAKTTQNYKSPGVFNAAQPDQNSITTYGYDKLGRTVAVTDTLGQVDLTHYNTRGQVDWTARNAAPAQFDANGLPLYHAYSRLAPDRNVNTIYGYDELGRSTFVTQTGILTGTFNTSTLQFSDVTTRTTRTEYDTLSRPMTVTLNYRAGLPSTADMNIKLYTRYDGASNVITQTDALGRWTVMQYDALNRPTKTIANYQDGNPLSGPADADLVSFTQYDVAGRVARTIDNYVDGAFTATQPITDRITLYQYDHFSRAITTTVNYTSTVTTLAELNRVSLLRYDPATMRLLGQRDPLGRWVSQQYDLLGRVTTSIQNCTGGGAPASCGSPTPDTNVPTRMLYDALSRTTLITDALSIVTQSTYDGLGRTTKTIQNYVKNGPTNTITNVTTLTRYDALGRTTVMTDALGYPTRQTFDGLGQTILVTDTMGRATRMGYDGQGMLRWSKPPTGQVTVYQVDGLGRTVATIVNYQDGVADTSSDQDLITRTVYDKAGRRVRTVDAMNRATVFAYDNLDRLITVTENQVSGSCTWAPCNVQTQYQYDRAGNRSALIDANSHIRRFSYDAASQQQRAIDALNNTTIYTYNQVGLLTAQQDPRDTTNKLTFGYDNLNRLNSTAATNLGSITRGYDQLGRTKVLTDSSGTTSFSYDSLGRMTRVTAPNTGSVTYGYTARGQRSQSGYPNSGPTVQYGYWPDGQLSVVTDTTRLANYTPDLYGRLAQLTRANGAVTTYHYDHADRPVESSTIVSGTIVGRFEYGLNRLGLRTAVTETLPLTPTLSPTWMETGSFETGNLLDPTSGVDQIFGSVQVETAAPIKGAFSARVPNSSDSYMRENIADTDNLFTSFYLRVTTAPGSNTRVLQISNRTGPSSFVTVANMQLTTSRRLRFRNDNTQIGLDSAQLTLGTVYRVGVWQKKGSGNGVLAAYLAAGDAPFTSAFALTDTLSLTTPAARVNLGASTGTAANIVVDEFRLDRGVSAPPALFLAARAGATTAAQAGNIAPSSQATPAEAPMPPAPDTGGARAAFSRLPLTFIPNAGQTDAQARFLLRGMGGTLFFTPAELVMALRPPSRPRQQGPPAPPRSRDREPRQAVPRAVLRQGYLGANGAATMSGALRLPGRANFLTGSDPAKWRTDLPTYAGMVYGQLYQGIDLHYSGTDGQLKTTYLVAPGADPTRIQWRYTGAQQVRVDTDGNLVVTVPAPPADLITDTELLSSTLIEQAPLAWQTINEREVAVPVRYVVAANGTVSFALGAYDRTKPLTIDPTLIYSTFLGGSGDESSAAITIDSAGNAYTTGGTSSTNFPTTGGTYDASLNSAQDAYITKLNASGSALVYSTYLGGSADDKGSDIRVDSTGNAYILGRTNSTNFPTTVGAYDTSQNGYRDFFVTKLNASGSALVYSTYLGGDSDETSGGLELDASGNVYISGDTGSTNFPTTVGAFDRTYDGNYWDGVVVKLNAAGTALIYSTLVGGSQEEFGYDLAIDGTGHAYFTGLTRSCDFPTANALRSVCDGGIWYDAFVTKLNTTGTALDYSTYLGGMGAEEGYAIAVDSAGQAYVTGYSSSTNFPTTTGALQTALVGNFDAFVVKFSAAGNTLVYSTYLGGAGDDFGTAITVDSAGQAHIAGYTDSTDYPTSNSFQGSYGGGPQDAFVTGLNATGNLLLYSTYMGGSGSDSAQGITIDAQGSIYIVGATDSTHFPVAYSVQSSHGGSFDSFVAKLGRPTRVVNYTYDGLLRLIGAVETPGNSYAYTYDLAGNRTSVQVNGGAAVTRTYNAADQITNAGYSYDLAGNLLTDGTLTYTYDALNRTETLAGGQSRTYTYNGDGVLVRQVAGATTTDYTQDLAAPLSQVLQTKVGATTTSSLYGLERLASRSGAPRTWYLGDALGSVRRTVADTGAANPPIFYDPWGTVESGSVPAFGFTGEQQDPATGLVNLRARWYSTSKGMFTSKDPFEGFAEQPYSLHPYQYAFANPVLRTDPSGFSPCYVCLVGAVKQNIVKSVYDKQGLSRDCTVTLDDGQNDLTDTVHDLFTDFICEYGTDDRFYPFNARLTQELYRKRAIIDYRATFYEQGYLEEEGTMGLTEFLNARDDAFDECTWTVFAGVNVCLSITDFLGGFKIKATKTTSGGQERVRFEVENRTNLASGTRIPGSKASILPEKPSRDPQVKTGLGGGNMSQTFAWEEAFDECFLSNYWWLRNLEILDPLSPDEIYPAPSSP